MNFPKNVNKYYVLLCSVVLCLAGIIYVGMSSNKDEQHLLAKTADMTSSKDSSEEESEKDSSEKVAIKDSSEKESEKNSFEENAPKGSSEEEPNKESTEKETTDDSQQEESEKDSSEKESPDGSVQEEPSKVLPEEDSSKVITEKNTNETVEKNQNKAPKQEATLKEDSNKDASKEVVGTDENLVNIDEEELEDNYYFSVIKNQTTEEFIEKIKKDAAEIAWKNDLYASVMIAQAILETGSGNSALSSEPNYNLFGVKGSYKGASVVMKTNEDDGKGNLFEIRSAFRKYPSYKQSLEDYADLLKNGISGNPNFYKNTWKSNAKSYTDVTAFLTGRYATDTHYAKKLNAIITTYQLAQYDANPSNKQEEDKSKQKNISKNNQKKANSKKNEAETNSKDKTTSKQSNKKFKDNEEAIEKEDNVGLMKRKIQDVSSDSNITFKGQ